VHKSTTVVYWGSPETDGGGGFTFADGVEIKARWLETKQLQLDQINGQEVIMQAVIYAEQAMDLKGYLMLGDLNDLDSASIENPIGESNARQIRATKSIHDSRTNRNLYVAWVV